jgi:predicted nucleic acid-binding protein
VSRWIVDVSLTLGWYLKDEDDRAYNLDVLAGLNANEAHVPFLWTYEVANVLVISQWRERLAESDITTILKSLKTLPITVDLPDADRSCYCRSLPNDWVEISAR